MFDNQRGSKAKAPNARSVVVDDLPSDISDDEWGEIQKFGQRIHEEKQRKEHLDHRNRVTNVRKVLDQQVAVRAELRQKAKADIVEFDKRILEQAKKEMEAETKHK